MPRSCSLHPVLPHARLDRAMGTLQVALAAAVDPRVGPLRVEDPLTLAEREELVRVAAREALSILGDG